MIRVVSLTFLVLAVVSLTSGGVLPRGPPADWNYKDLEDYQIYHDRYVALGCQQSHGTNYFDDCCHPLPKGHTLPNSCARENGSSKDKSIQAPDTIAPPESKQADSSNLAALPKAQNAPPAEDRPQDYVNRGGVATWYLQNGNPGACGEWHNDWEWIAAMNTARYGWTGQRSWLCGQRVRITNTANGRSVDVTIKDACPSCPHYNSIDLSVGAFQQLGNLDQGVIPIEWYFL